MGAYFRRVPIYMVVFLYAGKITIAIIQCFWVSFFFSNSHEDTLECLLSVSHVLAGLLQWVRTELAVKN